MSLPQRGRTREHAADAVAGQSRCIEALPRLGHDLKATFRITRRRTLRRADGTVSVEGGGALPGAVAVASPEHSLGPLRALGPQQRLSGGRLQRRAAVQSSTPSTGADHPHVWKENEGKTRAATGTGGTRPKNVALLNCVGVSPSIE